MILRFSENDRAIGESISSGRSVKDHVVGIVQNCGVNLRLPAALQRRSVCQNYEVQHVGRTYVGESVGGHLDGVGLSLGDELSLAVRTQIERRKNPSVEVRAASRHSPNFSRSAKQSCFPL